MNNKKVIISTIDGKRTIDTTICTCAEFNINGSSRIIDIIEQSDSIILKIDNDADVAKVLESIFKCNNCDQCRLISPKVLLL